MDNSEKKKNSWREEPWASREAKAQEFFTKKEAPWKRDLASWRRMHRKDAKACLEHFEKENDKYRERIERGIEAGSIIVAAGSEDSIHRWMQERVDILAHDCGLFEAPPKVLVHTSKSKIGKEMNGAGAWVGLPEYIELHDRDKTYFGLSGGRFRAVMAHELAHLVNEDVSAENTMQHSLRPPNQKREILAERLGAIIFGNPREYARWMADYENDQNRRAANSPAKYNRNQLSANGNARMLNRWVDMLERAGAVDANGDVIMKKAMPIYKRSKAFTESFLDASIAFGVEMPRSGRGRG